jgi:hypothetical protein
MSSEWLWPTWNLRARRCQSLKRQAKLPEKLAALRAPFASNIIYANGERFVRRVRSDRQPGIEKLPLLNQWQQ